MNPDGLRSLMKPQCTFGGRATDQDVSYTEMQHNENQKYNKPRGLVKILVIFYFVFVNILRQVRMICETRGGGFLVPVWGGCQV